jgi:hypothetical protein
MPFRGAERKDFSSVIPGNLKLFEPADIRRAFDYLEKTFRLNRDWYTDFKKELLRVERGMSEQEFFFSMRENTLDPPFCDCHKGGFSDRSSPLLDP